VSNGLISLQFRNSRIRGKIEHLRKGADDTVQREIDRIASEQPPAAVDDSAEALEQVHENLRRRAEALVRAGVATLKDFQDLL
jgi:hypothetical protein